MKVFSVQSTGLASLKWLALVISVVALLTACVRDIDVDFSVSSEQANVGEVITFTPKVHILDEGSDGDKHKNQKGKGHHHSNGVGHGNVSHQVANLTPFSSSIHDSVITAKEYLRTQQHPQGARQRD